MPWPSKIRITTGSVRHCGLRGRGCGRCRWIAKGWIRRGCRKMRVVFVTPSHQFPTGAIFPLERRLALLEWASRRNAVIVEDDYDGEFQLRRAAAGVTAGAGSRRADRLHRDVFANGVSFTAHRVSDCAGVAGAGVYCGESG